MERDHWSFGIGYVPHSFPSLRCFPWLIVAPDFRVSCMHPPFSRCVHFSTNRRRICPGVILAEKETFLGLAHMLWAFKIEPIPGVPIDLREYDGVSGRSPVPFVVRLTPRDSSVAEVLNL